MTYITLLNGSTVETGCLIDSHYGQYGPDLLIEIALGLGWTPENEQDRLLADCAVERANNSGPRLGAMDGTMDAYWEWHNAHSPESDRVEQPYDLGDEGRVIELILELSDDVEDWLNNQLPEPDCPYRFEWNDGDFGLYPMEEDDADL